VPVDHETRNWWLTQTSKCQGKGIFIFNKLNDIARWKSYSKDNPPEPYVCQKYLMNPLLMGGRKFDMRVYALCTSYNPLTIYLYRAGFARFAHERYDNTDTENLCKTYWI
jgi:tubulin polyglutamylase TTLL9